MPRVVFCPDYKIKLKDGREEAAMVMFGAINDLFGATKVRPKDIRILVVNCGVLNTTPSLSSMVIKHFKLRPNVQSFNLGGMGCAAGIVALDLGKDLINAHPGSYALVLVRTHRGMDGRSFNSIHLKEDAKATQGVSMSKDVIQKVLDEIQKNLELTEDYMEASRKTLERFGDASSSSVWYELAYLEATSKIKRGGRIWQLTFGSGFKCNSVVWKALKNVETPRQSPWFDELDLTLMHGSKITKRTK
ncbi:3-ketoacyl-CoA synthase 15 [Pyrus ussuriensis x Pyrus communis]|uniref:very-long-chain 3-oxoacyl-CoA synthase n=1 Tax=Pyrus ussuriensis x Pyrus communis TaxID=2448454 RepID=A0A5N5H5J0_9ROSA|nr:3-ketoacyl-CoA synthase 15 [Pyrus ussuriensis x Pyrus communis]